MQQPRLEGLRKRIAGLTPIRPFGRVISVDGTYLMVDGLGQKVRMGDQLRLVRSRGAPLRGEVLKIAPSGVMMLPDDALEGVALGDRVFLMPEAQIAPHDGWIGRVVDPYGAPLDGYPLHGGPDLRPIHARPPDPAGRGRMGARLETGMVLFNTMLPIVRGQRIGLFAGSGVGKTSLLGHFARKVEADVVVVALVGERGRELREFIDDVMGPEGMARSVVVAATSDRSPLVRRRCPAAAMAIAEYFRDCGLKVLFLADSITRLAEAHREVAVAGGEVPALRGYPPSMAHMIMSLCERAGPGLEGGGDITAIYTVLVAGSDMNEPVADVLRGVLDGHVVLDRAIAERGRYPAVNVLRSVSRSLPACAGDRENERIGLARKLMSAYHGSETMIKAGLYSPGGDLVLDQAVHVFDKLDSLIAQKEPDTIAKSFERLELVLREAEAFRPNQLKPGRVPVPRPARRL
ncbi:MAG: FliI/YscN family ATPase [Rhodobacteraceae bacterium]|nr:MAG: FliI/YscN family ATPase [Paracoccaceae bacterium]